jgi:outer membrane protein TolC
VGFSGGAFGGGSNLVPPLLGNFGGRTDFDIRAYWSLQNMGLGNMALWRQRSAQVGVALGDQSLTINRVRREVSAALADAIAARGRVEVTARQLDTAQAGFREDLDRIRGTVGLPIEVTNSLDLLAEARQSHLRAIIDYNRAEFRLFVALGSPPPLLQPENGPLPPAPIAWPPLPLPVDTE